MNLNPPTINAKGANITMDDDIDLETAAIDFPYSF